VGWVLRRVVVAILLLLAVFWVGIGWNWLGGMRQQLAVGRALERARSYAPPTTQHVVYDDDPRTYPLLLARGTNGGYVSAFRTIGGKQYAGYDNPDWNNWLRIVTQSQYSRTAPICFLHELTSPNGTRRIVTVQISSMISDSFNRLFVGPNVMDAPVSAGLPVMSPQLVMYRGPGAMVRVYDGQIDGNDRSRFMFVVEHNGQKIDVRGQLGDDGKVVLAPAAGQVDEFISELGWIPPGVIPPPQYMSQVRSIQRLIARQTPATMPSRR
jgi:hypothetical protein